MDTASFVLNMDKNIIIKDKKLGDLFVFNSLNKDHELISYEGEFRAFENEQMLFFFIHERCFFTAGKNNTIL